MKIHNKNGFEYHSDKEYFDGRFYWTYYYRPEAEEQWFSIDTNAFNHSVFTVKKEHVLNLLSNQELAKRYYYRKFVNMYDIDFCKKNLHKAKENLKYRKENPPKERADTHSNPGRLARDMKRDANWLSDAMNLVEQAQKQLSHAVNSNISKQKIAKAKEYI
ncbi:hypothetical protein [Enterovibrio baiacu]|uniref:hypothetical protein n=1 Tax=Enterovibrio baiacu TaxID=2491023 RepID=UPI003D129388